MFSVAGSGSDEHLKHLAALHRAVPVTRMVDYGVPQPDALAVHQVTASADPPRWDDACESAALRHIELASVGKGEAAGQAWRSASALLQCAQLAFSEDTPRKVDLCERAAAAMARHAALSDDLTELSLPTQAGVMRGWIVRPTGIPVTGAVVLVGGLRGWGAAYLDMGRALAARGLAAVLGEGPGQGLTRMHAGIHLDPTTLPLLSGFLDLAEDLGGRRLGAWGNSFGGLFVAHLAVRDPRVRALCTNGAPMAPTVPPFRTAREQMMAVFGVSSEEALASRLRALGLDADEHRTDAAMLVVQGGDDALVPLGSQEAFFGLSRSTVLSTMTWPDGQHTIYNHAPERNRRVAAWFAEQLGAGTRSAQNENGDRHEPS